METYSQVLWSNESPCKFGSRLLRAVPTSTCVACEGSVFPEGMSSWNWKNTFKAQFANGQPRPCLFCAGIYKKLKQQARIATFRLILNLNGRQWWRIATSCFVWTAPMNVELLFIINLSVLINHSNEKHARKRNHAFTAVSLTRRIYPKGWTRENGSLSLFCLAVAIEDAFKRERERETKRVVL